MCKRTNFQVWLATLVLLLGIASTAAGDIIYVDTGAPACGDGTSWPTAYKYLQDALAVAQSGDEIWVAEGTYRPDEDCIHPDGTGDRGTSFQLKNNVAIYGGFPSGGGGWEDRDPDNETILSGDLNGDDPANIAPADLLNHPRRAENSHNVVKSTRCTEATILDMLIITGGNANISGSAENGAGMFNFDNGNPTVRNCVFIRNSARNYGGGFLSQHSRSKPMLINCRFMMNYAYYGGGMCNQTSSAPTLINCVFRDNLANRDGGAISNDVGSPKLENCEFHENIANRHGGAIYNNQSYPDLSGCNFIQNTANSQGGAIHSTKSKPSITGCEFKQNTAGNNGGGVYNDQSDSDVISCTFTENISGDKGGGIFTQRSNPKVVRSMFFGNRADRGGAIEIYRGSPEIINCVFSANSAEAATGQGGAIYNDCECCWHCPLTTLRNCTFWGNFANDSGGGIANEHPNFRGEITNCIFWGNCDTGGAACDESAQIHGGTPIVCFSDIQGLNPTGPFADCNNINCDPCFVDPDGPDGLAGTEDDNLHLLPRSCAIDKGAPGSYVGETDIDEQARVMGPFVDMGADEVCDGCQRCKGDLDRNGFIMQSDLFEMISILGRTGPPYILADCQRRWNPCADMDDNGFIMISDMFALIAQLGTAGPPFIIPCP